MVKPQPMVGFLASQPSEAKCTWCWSALLAFSLCFPFLLPGKALKRFYISYCIFNFTWVYYFSFLIL